MGHTFLVLTAEKTSTVGNHVYLADFDDNRRIRHVGSHLACFHAGNWLLGNYADILVIPLRVVKAEFK
jgi:hypothetical protein